MTRSGKLAVPPLILLATAVLTIALLPAAVAADEPALWAVDVTRRVRPDDPPEGANRVWSARRREVRLRAVRGESEAFHLVVTAGGSPQSDLEITATELTGDVGSISRDHLFLYREAFFDVPSISDFWAQARHGETGPVPDALLPFVDPYGSGQPIGIPFDVAAGESQPIFVLVEVPPEASAGTYETTLELRRRAGGETLGEATLELEVLDVTLPPRPVFRAFFNLGGGTVGELHGNPGPARRRILERNALEELARRRISPGYVYPRLPSYDNRTGFDWSAVEDEWRHWLETRDGAVVNVGFIYDGDVGRYLIRRRDGSRYAKADLSPGSHFDTQARLFYARLWDDLEARDWADRAVAFLLEDDRGELADEPYNEGASSYQRLRSWADILRHPDAADPAKSFPFVVAGDSLYPSATYADLRGLVDVWDQYMDEVDINAEAYAERRESFGEELWVVANGYSDFLDYPSIYHRSLGFFAWKTGATGMEHWDTMAWYNDREELVSPWSPADLTPVWGWGSGALMWPGQDIERRGIDIDGPLPSLRLELNRQAFEDYDLLALLEDAFPGEGFGPGASGLASSVALAAVPGRLFDGLDIDRDQFERCRAAALDALAGGATPRRVTGWVRKRGGQPLAGALVGNGTFAARTGSDGNFALTVPAGGPVTLNATLDGFLPATVNVTRRQRRARFTLRPLAKKKTVLFGSFERSVHRWSGEGVTVALSSSRVRHGARSMRVVFKSSAKEPVIYPDSVIRPRDWSQWDFFLIDVYNASQYLTELDFAIYDRDGKDSFHIFFLNPDEWTKVRIPIAAIRTEPSDIDAIEVYADAAGRGDRELFFDYPRLVRRTGGDGSAPGPPSSLAATVGEDPPRSGTARPWVGLSWQAPAFDAGRTALTGTARYEVLRGPGGDAAPDVLNRDLVLTEPAFRDLEVAPGESWTYSVRAVDFAGNAGPASDPATVEIPE